MYNENSAGCDSASECDYYSECWEESSFKDLVDSDSEGDLYLCCHQNFSCSSFEGKSKLSEIVLISENNQTNFRNSCKNCPLLQVQNLETTRDFQEKSSSGAIWYFTFEGPQTRDYPSRAYSCDGSCQDTLCLSSGIPHLIITDKLVKQQTFHTDKELCQKQTPADCPVTSGHKKSVQVSFHCTETEVLENTEGKRFKRSLVCDDINKTPVKEPIIFHSYHENTCNKNKNSSQLITESLDYSSEILDKTDRPHTPERIGSCSSSGDLVISLTLEAAYPTDSLAVNITTSEAEVGTKDSRRHALAFNFKGSEQKLYISVIPNSLLLNTESPKRTTSCTKQTGLPKILVDEVSQPLSSQKESSASSSPDFYLDQVPSTLKPQAPSQTFVSSKQAQVTQCPYFFVRSFPYKVLSTDKIFEVQKNQLKAFKPMKSIVFPKKEVRKDQKIRNKSYGSSKFHWYKNWDVDSVNQNTHDYKTVQELEINELYYVPQTSTCHCSPLLDLSVKLNSEQQFSGTAKPLSINRKLHKRTRAAKVMPRFSSQYLINPRSNFERLHYISPSRKRNHLKMQNILNSCLKYKMGQNRHENCQEEVRPLVDRSNARGNGFFTPHLSTDVGSTAPLLSSSGNSPVPLPHTGSAPNEKRHSPIPCLQRPAWSPAALGSLQNERQQSPSHLQTQKDTSPVVVYSLPRYSPASYLKAEKESWDPWGGQCNPSCKYCANIVKVAEPQKKRNMFNMEEVDSEAAQVTCGDLALKKLLVCPCGSMPQCGLFPNGDISQSISTKARKRPDVNQRTSVITKSDAINYPRGTLNTMDTYCSKCHHLLPSHCRQEVLRRQFTKAQSYFEDGFPMKNLKEDTVQKCKEVKTGERKNVRIHAGPGISQQTGPLSPSNDGYSVPEYAVYEAKCCSCCPNIVKQHCGTSGEASTNFSSKYKWPEDCLKRQQAFLTELRKRSRNWCTCSQETPLFCVDQTDTYNRAALLKRKDSENTQDSLQIHHGCERHDKSHQCCQDKVHCHHLQ